MVLGGIDKMMNPAASTMTPCRADRTCPRPSALSEDPTTTCRASHRRTRRICRQLRPPAEAAEAPTGKAGFVLCYIHTSFGSFIQSIVGT